ncbi:ATP/GTP-binding protein [Treponema sp. OMZ 792]|uniref:P-loop NTPase fold protein n=1 Tax=unclassified Treponema TaxID=2638727 RepID=UPI0020A4EC51|nr:MULTISPECIES: P-loop NTPase fold protein [unclassified Treponema]UTC74414.1 ATP/GTP-binding protein [Treponema sp. OMZ 792]UTC80810.1 ATP/GTP-binding protein [Treponema sp. OMZ 798]
MLVIILCAEDLFTGKAHTTIAKNICDTIKNNSDCRMIGLDGSWGSGKSNLLKIVEKQLNQQENEKYHFFLYDAWGHQEDIQRRAILENLTDFLVNEKKILGSKKWEEKCKNLESRTKETEVKTIPRLSISVMIGIFSIIITPALKPLSDLLQETCPKVSKYIFFTPLSLFIVAVCYIILKYLFGFFKKQKKQEKFIHIFNDIFAFYTKDRKDTITHEIISERNPSSKDFKDWIEEVSNDLINNNLIIIFDNMDRLPSDKVQELWSSIHSFFAEERYEHIWVIVPFDRQHIRNAFKKEDIQILTKDNDKDKDNFLDEYICYGDDFINKTFDVVYRVSPPIMSDWKNYFRIQWKEAFGNTIDQDNYENVMQIYDMLTIEQSPRKIIAFINEIVTIKQIVEDAIPYQYIALYIFGKQKITEKGIIEIFSPTFLGAIEFLYKNDTDLAKYLAALHYQLPPEEVESVIFREKLKQSLDNNDANTVKEISESPIFIDALESAVPIITNIGNAVESINKIFDDKMNTQYAKYIWKVLYNKARDKVETKLENYQYILLSHIEAPAQYLETIISMLANNKNFNPQQYYNDITKLTQLKNIDVFSHLMPKKLQIEQFIVFINLAKANINKYKITCDNNEIDTYLSELKLEKLKGVTFIPYLTKKDDLEKYKSKLIDGIKNNYDNKEYIEILYTRLKELERPVQKDLLSDSNIYSLFTDWDSKNDFYYDLICMRIAQYDNFNSSYSIYFDTVLNSNDPNIVKKISERIEYYTSYGDILLHLPEMEFPVYKAVAQELTKNSYGISSAHIEKLLMHYDSINEKLELSHDVLLSHLNAWRDFAVKAINESNISDIPIAFFKAVHTENINNELTKHCMNTLSEYLKNLKKEDWIESIKDQTFAYKVLDYSKIPLEHSAVTALEEVIENFIKSESGFANCSAQIKYLISKAENDNCPLQTGAKNVRDIFTNGKEKMNANIFSVIGSYLLKYGKLEEKKEALRTLFPADVIDSHIEILLKFSDIIKKIMDRADEPEQQTFINEIKTGMDRNEKIKEFAEKLWLSKGEDEKS